MDKLDFEQYKEKFSGSGESVIQLAYYAQFMKSQNGNDAEFILAAKNLICAEDHFAELLEKRGIERG